MADDQILGAAVFQLRLDFEQFKKDFDSAQDTAKGHSDNIQTGLAGIKNAVNEVADSYSRMFSAGNIATMITAVFGAQEAFAALKDVVHEAISAFTAAEDAETKLNLVLDNMGERAGLSGDALQNMAADMSDVSGNTVATIENAMALASTFQNINDPNVFKQLMQASMDLSAFWGTDMTTSSMQLARALDNPASAAMILKRMHISLTAAEKEGIKTSMALGDTLGAQQIILDAVKRATHDAAEEMGETLSGKTKKAKAAFDEMFVAIGTALAGPLKEFMDYMKDFARVMENFFLSVSNAWAALVAALGGIAKAAMALLSGHFAEASALAKQTWADLMAASEANDKALADRRKVTAADIKKEGEAHVAAVAANQKRIADVHAKSAEEIKKIEATVYDVADAHEVKMADQRDKSLAAAKGNKLKEAEIWAKFYADIEIYRNQNLYKATDTLAKEDDALTKSLAARLAAKNAADLAELTASAAAQDKKIQDGIKDGSIYKREVFDREFSDYQDLMSQELALKATTLQDKADKEQAALKDLYTRDKDALDKWMELELKQKDLTEAQKTAIHQAAIDKRLDIDQTYAAATLDINNTVEIEIRAASDKTTDTIIQNKKKATDAIAKENDKIRMMTDAQINAEMLKEGVSDDQKARYAAIQIDRQNHVWQNFSDHVDVAVGKDESLWDQMGRLADQTMAGVQAEFQKVFVDWFDGKISGFQKYLDGLRAALTTAIANLLAQWVAEWAVEQVKAALAGTAAGTAYGVAYTAAVAATTGGAGAVGAGAGAAGAGATGAGAVAMGPLALAAGAAAIEFAAIKGNQQYIQGRLGGGVTGSLADIGIALVNPVAGAALLYDALTNTDTGLFSGNIGGSVDKHAFETARDSLISVGMAAGLGPDTIKQLVLAAAQDSGQPGDMKWHGMDSVIDDYGKQLLLQQTAGVPVNLKGLAGNLTYASSAFTPTPLEMRILSDATGAILKQETGIYGNRAADYAQYRADQASLTSALAGNASVATIKALQDEMSALKFNHEYAASYLGAPKLFAEGGIVNRPTLAVIGEKGPEAVVPLSGPGAGGGITLVLDGMILGRVLNTMSQQGRLKLDPAAIQSASVY